MAVKDLISQVKNFNLQKAISSLDQNKQQAGFQFISPQVKQNVGNFFQGARQQAQARNQQVFQPIQQSFQQNIAPQTKNLFQQAGNTYFKVAEPVQGKPVQNFLKGLVLTPKAEAQENSRLLGSDFTKLSQQDKGRYVDLLANYTVFGLAEGGLKTTKNVGEEVLQDTLKQEARKYKSAEEFVKYVPKEYENAKATLRYGNPNQFDVPSRLRATPAAADRAKAGMQPIITKESIDRAGNKYTEIVDGWHRLASAKQAGLKEIPILHISDSGTPIKSQLTDIYNQATKGQRLTKTEKLLQEIPPQTKPLSEITNTAEKKVATQSIVEEQTKRRFVGKDLSSLEGSVAELPNITSDNALKHKVTFLDYFRTPDRVLQKIGLGKQAEQLKQAHGNYVQRLPKEIDKITQWWERVGKSEQSSQRIFQYLDGQKVRLSKTEKEVAGEMKTYLKEWADELGLPEDKRIANYITHIFENNLINKEFDPELEKIIANKVPGSVYDPFLQERLGKQGYIEDVFRAMDAYVKRATRKASMDPALESLKGASKDLPLQSWNYVKNYSDRINLRPTELDNLVDSFIKQTPIEGRLGQRPVANITRRVRNSVYRATLGLNIGSALRNLTQGANTYAQLGERYTAEGYFEATRSLLKNSDELDRVGVTADSFIQDRNLSAKKQLLQKLDEGLWAMFDMAEKINRGAAYYGAKARALNAGKSMGEAIQEGVEMARKTQFTFGSVDTPVALQGDVAKTLLQFQSYNVKQLEFLGDMVKEKNVAGLVRYLAAWALFAKVGGDVLGLDWKDAIPFSSDITEGKTRIGQTPAIQAATGLIKAAVGAPDKYGQPAEGNVLERLQQQGVPESLGATFIPGFVQGKKTIQGIQTVNQGYSTSKSGRIRTPVEQNVSNFIKAATLGQYSLKEVNDFFDKEQSVLGEKQTETFKTLLKEKGVEEAGRYYESIIQGRERDALIKTIKEGTAKDKRVDTSLISTSDARDIIKSYIEAGVDVSEEELYTAYLYSPLSMPQSNRYEKAKRDSSLYSSISTIDKDERLSPDQREILKIKIATELGKTPEDLDRYIVAKEDNNTKTLWALDQIDTFQSQDEVVRMLIQGRKPVNGEIIISDGVIDNLVNDNIIPAQLGKELKDLDINEDGTLKKKKTKTGSYTVSKNIKAYQQLLSDIEKIKTSTPNITVPKLSSSIKSITFGR